jgi:hypothetical protein
MANAPTFSARIAALAVAVAGGLAGCPALAQPAPTTVLELFTSQGCKSCPAADALFAQYAKRPDVLALTFNVDYWDYLGWKDTLASPDHSDRQRQYAVASGDGHIYTPQVVVDGRTHVVGSDPRQVDKAIVANAGSLTVPLTLSASTDAVTVTVAGATQPDLPHATLWLVMYNPSVTVPVDKGENGGKSLTYTNVVRKLRPIAMWKGSLMTVDIPMSELMRSKAIRGAVILQVDRGDGRLGPVIGVATVDLKPAAAQPAPATGAPPAPASPAGAR